jgi:hypothetical protein
VSTITRSVRVPLPELPGRVGLPGVGVAVAPLGADEPGQDRPGAEPPGQPAEEPHARRRAGVRPRAAGLAQLLPPVRGVRLLGLGRAPVQLGQLGPLGRRAQQPVERRPVELGPQARPAAGAVRPGRHVSAPARAPT